MLWWILFAVVLLYILVQVYNTVNYWKYKGITHVKPWPLLGSMGKNLMRQISMADQLQILYNRYPEAKFVGLHQLNKPVLMVRDPELLKLILVKNFDNFIDHTIIFTEDVEPLFGKSLVSLKGQRWRDMRATLSPAFTSSKMRAMYTLINDCALQFSQHFLEVAKEKGSITLEMKDIFTRFTNDVIATSAFGIKCDSLKEENNEFYMTGKKMSKFGLLTTLKFLTFMIFPKLMKIVNVGLFSEEIKSFFNTIIKTTMETREREGIIRPDMIHLLMEAQKGHLKHETSNKDYDEDAGFATVQESNVGKAENTNKTKLTDADITAQAVLFFLAGYDTSSTAMCFLAYELAVNVDIQEKLQTEIDVTFKKCNGNVTYESLLNMKYLDMVISECLRKWPPAAVTDRLCSKPYTLADENESVLLEKDLTVWIPVYCLHRDPKYFPEPDKFDPERFNDENKNSIIPFTYLPFGGGPRNCIGSRFALLEIKALFVHLLSKFNLTVVEKTQVPLKLSKIQFAMAAEKGFWLGIEPRK